MITVTLVALAAALPRAGPTAHVDVAGAAGPMRRRLLRSAVAGGAGACLALTAGCGGDGLPSQLTPGQRADLHTLVGQARTAAGAGDLAGTNAALARLKARVRTLRDDGALGEDRAAELLKYAAVAELKAGRTVRAPEATPPTPAPTPAPEPDPAADDDLGEITPPPAATRGPPGKSKQPKAKGRDKDDEGDD